MSDELAQAKKDIKHWESLAYSTGLELKTIHDAFLAEQQACVDALSKLSDTRDRLNKALELMKDIHLSHTHTDSCAYNGCEIEPCLFCKDYLELANKD